MAVHPHPAFPDGGEDLVVAELGAWLHVLVSVETNRENLGKYNYSLELASIKQSLGCKTAKLMRWTPPLTSSASKVPKS